MDVPLGNCVVSAGEVQFAIRASRKSGSPALGLDGIVAGVWRRVPSTFALRLADVFTRCLSGVFPAQWKRTKLVLIPKGGSFLRLVNGGIPKARPICLLDKVGKIFERIIVD